MANTVLTCPDRARLNNFPPVSEYGRTITFRVGKDLKEFVIHKGLLSHYSSIFRDLFAKATEDNNDLVTLDLPDDSIRAFKALFSWLHTRSLSTDLSPNRNAEKQAFAAEKLIELYLLAESKQIILLKNQVANALAQWLQIGWILDFTSPKHGCIRTFNQNNWAQKANLWKVAVKDVDFWADVVVELIKYGGKGRWGVKGAYNPGCDFHDHSDIEASTTPVVSTSEDAVRISSTVSATQSVANALALHPQGATANLDTAQPNSPVVIKTETPSPHSQHLSRGNLRLGSGPSSRSGTPPRGGSMPNGRFAPCGAPGFRGSPTSRGDPSPRGGPALRAPGGSGMPRGGGRRDLNSGGTLQTTPEAAAFLVGPVQANSPNQLKRSYDQL
ncbi:hypothetical protein EJ08DRAFT_699733 [Tothia fuscella]|uniref:BTB domain-containing protein n=1 Tax=Tothia fuscella TaxID=1048955 RepID=A0A9P4TVB1_9PEZI|nr:hypothetical protein EJ08DRAFT_699733 [Tothia fuscella]